MYGYALLVWVWAPSAKHFYLWLYLCLAKKSATGFFGYFMLATVQWKRGAQSETTMFATCAHKFTMCTLFVLIVCVSGWVCVCVCVWSIEDRTDRGRPYFSLSKQTLTSSDDDDYDDYDYDGYDSDLFMLVCVIVYYFSIHSWDDWALVLGNVDPRLFPTSIDSQIKLNPLQIKCSQ